MEDALAVLQLASCRRASVQVAFLGICPHVLHSEHPHARRRGVVVVDAIVELRVTSCADAYRHDGGRAPGHDRLMVRLGVIAPVSHDVAGSEPIVC